jgi:hypothetical protein
MTSNYNGAKTPYNVQSISVSPGPNGGLSETFLVPFKGGGSYLFTGSILNSKGTLLCQATIDPVIEPEW